MNRIWLFILLVVSGSAKAQLNERAVFQVRIADTSNREFFKEYPNLDYVDVTFNDGKADWIGVHYLKQSIEVKKEVVESYIGDFEGHLYLIKRKYPKLNLEKCADLSVQKLPGIENLRDSNVNYTLSTTLRRDSTTYHFFINTITGKIYPGPFNKWGRAALKGDIRELQTKLINSYNSWKPIRVTDSVLFIKGIVEKNGSLGNLTLEGGGDSTFSEKVMAFIKREANSWWPANSGRKIQYHATFFVRLNKDDSITFDVL